MKNFIIFTLTFLPILLFGQNPRVFTVKCNISQSGGGAVVCPVFYNGVAWVSH